MEHQLPKQQPAIATAGGAMTATPNTPEQMTLCLLGRPEQVVATVRCLGFIAPTVLEPRPQKAEYFDIATPGTSEADPAQAVPPFPECFGNLSELAEEHAHPAMAQCGRREDNVNSVELPKQSYDGQTCHEAWEPATPKRQLSRMSSGPLKSSQSNPMTDISFMRHGSQQLQGGSLEMGEEHPLMKAVIKAACHEGQRTSKELTERFETLQLDTNAGKAEIAAVQAALVRSEAQAGQTELEELKHEIVEERHMSQQRADTFDASLRQLLSEYQSSNAELVDMKATIDSEAAISASLEEAMSELNAMCRSRFKAMQSEAKADRVTMEGLTAMIEEHAIQTDPTEAVELKAVIDEQHHIASEFRETCEVRLKNLQSEIKTAQDEVTMTNDFTGMCEERLKNMQSDIMTGKNETSMLKAHFGNLLAAWESDCSTGNA